MLLLLLLLLPVAVAITVLSCSVPVLSALHARLPRNLAETATVWAKSETEIDTFNKMLHSFRVDATRRVTLWHLMPTWQAERQPPDCLRGIACECECENNPMKFASTQREPMCRRGSPDQISFDGPIMKHVIGWSVTRSLLTPPATATATCNAMVPSCV